MKFAVRVAVLTAALALGGCATTENPKDPFEQFNRAMFTFNDAVDEAALKPTARAYRDYLPQFVQTGIGNFFGNLGDVWTAVNNLLQGKMGDGVTDVMRIAVNSTFGLGGVIDIASEAGMPKHREDFGQTLGKWGVKSGPYVVLPLLGPSTLRDTVATPVNFEGDPWSHVTPIALRNTGMVVRVIDQRAVVLDVSTLLEEAALDRYVFVRDAYLQRRESQVRDGESPRTSYELEEEEQEAADAARERGNPEATTSGAVQLSAEPGQKPLVEPEQNTAAGSNAATLTAEKNAQ